MRDLPAFAPEERGAGATVTCRPVAGFWRVVRGRIGEARVANRDQSDPGQVEAAGARTGRAGRDFRLCAGPRPGPTCRNMFGHHMSQLRHNWSIEPGRRDCRQVRVGVRHSARPACRCANGDLGPCRAFSSAVRDHDCGRPVEPGGYAERLPAREHEGNAVPRGRWTLAAGVLLRPHAEGRPACCR